MSVKPESGSFRLLVHNLRTMDQVPKVEHERLNAIEVAAKALVANIYRAGAFGIPTVDPADLAALKKALKPLRRGPGQ
ncbi:MAG: hypothetical protein BGO25_05605 [Acidobacteriales bacterium 59-55]|nr:hypothetical protein [Terriglobales bacterium]OJV44558.1 MAG: hypothetical protein BGO25_05605 [Acidobacteriales bacterium 59-55]